MLVDIVVEMEVDIVVDMVVDMITWSFSPSWQKSPQPEDDSSLILQHYLGSKQNYA